MEIINVSPLRPKPIKSPLSTTTIQPVYVSKENYLKSSNSNSVFNNGSMYDDEYVTNKNTLPQAIPSIPPLPIPPTVIPQIPRVPILQIQFAEFLRNLNEKVPLQKNSSFTNNKLTTTLAPLNITTKTNKRKLESLENNAMSPQKKKIKLDKCVKSR
eukprot:229088_1